MQHSYTQNVITGEGYNILGTHFGGAGFLTVNLRRAKILEPLLYK